MQDKTSAIGALFRGAAKKVSDLGHKGTQKAFSKARDAGADTLKGKAYTAAGKASDIARKHPGKTMAGAGGVAAGVPAGVLLSGGKEKRASGDMLEAVQEKAKEKKVKDEAKKEGETPTQEAAEHVGTEKVKEEVKEEQAEKKASVNHYPNQIEKTAAVETKIGEGIGWQ